MQEIQYIDITLLQRIADGDEAAFIQFFKATSPVIYADISTVLQDDKAGRIEALQETYVKLWLYRDKLPQMKHLDVHMREVALKECYMYLFEPELREPLPVPHEDDSFVPRYHYQEYQSQIHDFIVALPEQRRLIYEMHRLQGMKVAEIGQRLGLSDEAVLGAIHAVQLCIRQCVKELEMNDKSSSQHQWVAAGRKKLEEQPPVAGAFNEHWLPLATRAMAVDRPIPADSSPVVRKVYSRRLNKWYAIAALIFLMVGPGIYLLLRRADNKLRLEVLPDQTKVWLKKGSTVTYAGNFSARTRDLTVAGEARFQVAQEPLQPFHIKTGALGVTVQGTHFDVRSYQGKLYIIPLDHSSVTVNQGDMTKTIHAGQQAVISQDGLISSQ